ncbi:hypothetical protein FRACA_590032 [Frankia canadensis]|uniref:Uncharacterized protein n=1 Tax=Frankia canadensis TaxID=1836972 RepID=A0A2I2KZD2_9ACTN|nr:hypothetical protein FRACA_590032 [Frankia canadensis]SOU58300.1 hypothetical protein FRACA_590032 [Frankia canadensis]
MNPTTSTENARPNLPFLGYLVIGGQC